MPASAHPRVDVPRGETTQLERVLRLRALRGFAHMTPNELAVIAENTVDRWFDAGAEIYPEGRPVDALHFVLAGAVAVRRKGVTLDVLEAPAAIGGLATLAGLADGQQVVAERDCWTLEMPADIMEDVFEDNFTLLLQVMRNIARQFIEARKVSGPMAGFLSTDEPTEAPGEALGVVERLFYLRKSITFAAGRVELLIGLARSSRERRERAGEVLWRRGDRSPTWLVIVSGEIVGRTDDQEFRFGPGDAAGSLDSLAAEPRWYDAEVASDLVALELDMEVLIDLFEDNVDLALGLARAIAGLLIELREANARMRSAERKAR